MPLPLAADVPRGHEFGWQAFDLHVEFFRRRLRLRHWTAIFRGGNKIPRRTTFARSNPAALNESAKSLIAGDDLQPAHILVLKQAGLPPAAD
jgi:hypothetical protein